MRNVSETRRKESSLQPRPANSLQLMHIAKFIEEYLHTQQRCMINLSANFVQSILPLNEFEDNMPFDIDLNVPYIQSEHYDSHATFTEDVASTNYLNDLGDQNFTERQESSVREDYMEEMDLRRKEVVLEDQSSYNEEDFQFIKHEKSVKESEGSRNTQGSFTHSVKLQEETKPVIANCLRDELQLQHLQETAYFLQAQQMVERKLTYGSHQSSNHETVLSPNNENVSQEGKATSKKAVFLNKIEKEKTRKEIAQMIGKERHHIRKFLK